MPSFLEKILKSRKAPPTAEDFRRLQTDAEKEVEHAQAAVEAAQQAYEASLLDADPAATKAARAKLIDAEDDHNRAVARLAAIRAEFLAACEAEAEADRVARYEASRAQLRDAEKALKRYPTLAAQIAEIVRQAAVAEIEAIAVNADLPSGAAPLPLPETIRGWPERPGAILNERIVDAGWYYKSHPGVAVDENFLRFIEIDENGLHWLVYQDGFQHKRSEVIRRWKRVRRVRVAQGAVLPDRLLAELCLPGFKYGDPAIFTPRPDHSRIISSELPKIALQHMSSPTDSPSRDPRSEQDEVIDEELLDVNEADQIELDAALAAGTM